MPAVRLRASCGGIAQLEEHLLCKQGVSGSNPLTSTRIREQGAGNQGFDELTAGGPERDAPVGGGAEGL